MCSYKNGFFNPWESAIFIRKVSHGCKKSFSQLHILVELEYLFLCKFFDLEILHTCYQYKDDFIK